jgi:hypothetical protein
MIQFSNQRPNPKVPFLKFLYIMDSHSKCSRVLNFFLKKLSAGSSTDFGELAENYVDGGRGGVRCVRERERECVCVCMICTYMLRPN